MPSPPFSRLRARWLGLAVLLAAVLGTVSCSGLGYYGQAAWGQARILAARQNIVRLVDDPKTPEELRGKLRAVLRIRDFAVRELGLPDNGSYRSYVQLEPEDDGSRRRSVVWNVVAAPELSTEPVTWCFPVAGCVSYRGYFSRARARRFADRLERRGYDVAVSGASAYSTLGWFKDPVLSTVIDYPEVDLAGLLFHELAHQLIYVAGDTPFNESFATTVEIEGVRRWLEATGQDASVLEGYLARLSREEDFTRLVLEHRDRLAEMYEQDLPEDEKLARKRELFAALGDAYQELRESWGGAASYDGWFAQDLNNAHLVSVGAYHDLVPEFQALLARQGGELAPFYGVVREIGDLDAEERQKRLDAQPSGR